ncbi:MAG: GGDEF domain-containing protein [gamma proteobacterium symbiont of Lucinoma myriamae]|nr:GGDEF domain-containing protein [gamma proteobacterium symbiont of Lucinoma myriamae]MCU7819217.1 GGDEF domain-containing protein [gamma proteobacterium symbiont of Lucinoma myriamae]MCU7832587.1 GGDEF domain-containing protein [gamma proteobacterium symbiont of Lucinoma myriamae]
MTGVHNNNNSYILFITLDKFIAIKDKLGDINSDQFIVDIANLLKNTITDDTSLARFESYRFSAIVNTDDEKQALQIAENICKIVSDHIADVSNKSITTTCSIGVSIIDSSSNGAQSILTDVRKACVIASEMNNQQLAKYWSNEVNNAIKQKRMFLVFQPFVSLLGEGSENFEIFIRLRNEQGDTILPNEFLTPLETSSDSLHIDRWVIAEAIQTLAERLKAGHKNRFIIKLTSASLNDDKFISWVKHNLERFQVDAESVIFQIKAHQAAENLRQTQQISKQLHKLGCKFSFEHFGKEQNAFALLKHIKADFLKLDGELVKNISTNADKLTELTLTCAQANQLDVKTIVPFVEEAGSLSVIWQSGAEYI